MVHYECIWAAQEDQKENFLRELASFCSGCSEPYIVGGDFNILRFSFKKNKMFSPNRFFDMFNSVINTFDLRELGVVSLGLMVRKTLLWKSLT
jgi:endonuclease/exonuclease/phosphatase (EEP) superfamily protein YafD